MAKSALELRLIAALEAESATHGIDVVDVEVTGALKVPRVCVRIDHAGEDAPTITLDELSEQGTWIDAVIDEVDPFESRFTLEVSSPGMDRPLRRPRDFERFAGSRVAFVTTATEGRRRYTGTITGMADDRVLLSCDDGDFSFGLDEVESCRIKPDYGSAAAGGRPTRGSE